MKRILLSVMSIILFMSMFMTEEGRAESIFVDNLQISIDNNMINETALITEEGYILIPLRGVLEGIGADVRWEAETREVYFDYLDKNYVCRFEPPIQDHPEHKFALICEVENKESILFEDYIQLSSMDATCGYENINGRIYLYAYGVEYLMKYFNYSTETDLENKKITITSNASDI